MYISASAPDAPPLSDPTIGCFIRLFFWIAACIMRAIWSEAPPAPAATTISTGLVGSQDAARAGAPASINANAAVALMSSRTCFIPLVLMGLLPYRAGRCRWRLLHATGLYRRPPADSSRRTYYFRMTLQILGGRLADTRQALLSPQFRRRLG